MDSLKFIIVDDDPMSIEILKSYASKLNNLTLKGVYSNILDAINKNKEETPDLIILDVELPEMSGLDYLKNFKKRPLIVMVSGNPEYAVGAFEYDAIDFLLKPINFARFVKSIQKISKMNELLRKFEEE
jgi:two-component system, LytTR family, response regulator